MAQTRLELQRILRVNRINCSQAKSDRVWLDSSLSLGDVGDVSDVGNVDYTQSENKSEAANRTIELLRRAGAFILLVAPFYLTCLS